MTVVVVDFDQMSSSSPVEALLFFSNFKIPSAVLRAHIFQRWRRNPDLNRKLAGVREAS